MSKLRNKVSSLYMLALFMADSQRITLHALYSLLRYTPVLAALLIVDLTQLAYPLLLEYFDSLMRLVVVLLGWGIAEGVCMLWVREKNLGSERARGYGALAILLAFIVLFLLQAFRLRSSQLEFIILLAALSLRGMTRAGWEQGRPSLSAATAIISHSLIAFLSFLLALDQGPWPTMLISLGFGALVGALEATWHADAIAKEPSKFWLAPLHRVSLAIAPLIIGSLSVTRLLAPSYLSLFALLLAAISLGRVTTASGSVATGRFVRTAGLYALFLLMLAGCHLYSNHLIR